MSSIDNSEIAGVTIGGTEVQEITVDGQTVYTNGPTVKTFSYTGSRQAWTVPSGVNQITVRLHGANGGGYVEGTKNVNPGDTIYVYVGGDSQIGSGGWPDGGSPANANQAGGAGSTQLRRNGDYLSDRFAVAGGSGGRGEGSRNADSFSYATRGDGGANIGEDGEDAQDSLRLTQVSYGGHGGTQNSGGSGGSGDANGDSGSQNHGGTGGVDTYGSNAAYGGCGGGGYYGGGGGGAHAKSGEEGSAGGAGGSNYVGGLNSVTSNIRGGSESYGDGKVEIIY